MSETKAIRTKIAVKEDVDVDNPGMFIYGYFSTFGGDPDSVNDIIDKGAFKRTIDQRGPEGSADIVGMWRHRDPMGPLVELGEDEKGGRFRMKLSDTPENRDSRWKYLTDGVVKEVSFMFDPIKWYYEKAEGESEWDKVRHLQEVKLFEISVVPFGANSNTSIDGFKERIEKDLGLPGLFSSEDVDAKVERILSTRNQKIIDDAIASMGGAIKKLEALLKATDSDVAKSTPSEDSPIEKADPDIDLSVHLATLETLNQVIKSLKG